MLQKPENHTTNFYMEERIPEQSALKSEKESEELRKLLLVHQYEMIDAALHSRNSDYLIEKQAELENQILSDPEHFEFLKGCGKVSVLRYLRLKRLLEARVKPLEPYYDQNTAKQAGVVMSIDKHILTHYFIDSLRSIPILDFIEASPQAIMNCARFAWKSLRFINAEKNLTSYSNTPISISGQINQNDSYSGMFIEYICVMVFTAAIAKGLMISDPEKRIEEIEKFLIHVDKFLKKKGIKDTLFLRDRRRWEVEPMDKKNPDNTDESELRRLIEKDYHKGISIEPYMLLLKENMKGGFYENYTEMAEFISLVVAYLNGARNRFL